MGLIYMGNILIPELNQNSYLLYCKVIAINLSDRFIFNLVVLRC